MKESLLDIAFRIQIDPFNTVHRATKVDTVIKVLSNITKSYNQYLEIEFLKNTDFKKRYEIDNKIFDPIKKELNLLVVDLNYGSFEAALAPNILEEQIPLFADEILDWKKEAFQNYKEVVVYGDYNNPKHQEKIVEKYTDEERQKIFQPFLASVGDGKEYLLNITNKEHQLVKKIIQPEKSKLHIYIPETIKEKQKPEYKTLQVVLKVKNADGEPNITKKNIGKVLYVEELEHETYPYKPEVIRYSNLVYILTKKLDCEVEFNDNIYFIRNSELDIVVWAESRKQVEDAFAFSFHSLYLNYYLENDNNLSAEAIDLKIKLDSIIKSIINNVINEAEKD